MAPRWPGEQGDFCKCLVGSLAFSPTSALIGEEPCACQASMTIELCLPILPRILKTQTQSIWIKEGAAAQNDLLETWFELLTRVRK